MFIKKYIKIYFLFCKYTTIKTMTYRTSFFVELLVEFGYSFSRLFFIGVVYANVNVLAGWDYYEILFFMGLNIVSSELMLGAFSIWNLRELPEKIKNGEIDIALLKPVHSMFTLTMQFPYTTSFISCLPGVALMIYSASRLDYSISLSGIVFGTIVFILGFIVAYAILVIFASLTFKVSNADTLPRIGELIILDFKINPHQIYDHGLKIMFYYIFPVVFMASIPASIMLHGAHLGYILTSMALVFLFLFLTVKIWNFMIKSYTSAGG